MTMSDEVETQEPQPYVKPAVERIPLSDARTGPLNPQANDGAAASS